VGPQIIARNYAETLFALAKRHGGQQGIEEYLRAVDEVAELLRQEPRVREFLESPRVDVEAKQRALRASFAGRVPEMFLRFLLVVVEKRRQGLLREIAEAFHALVNEAYGRVPATITLAQAPDPALQQEIVAALQQRLGKVVVPTFHVDPELIGGLVVRVGDQILDGSLRSRLGALRRRMLAASLPQA
jgi:F-type H+-transporting ATPase subunit delta